MWNNFLKKFVRFLDPKLEKYREPKAKTVSKYTPKDLKDFIEVLQRTPKSILSSKDRDRIAAVMSFDGRTVGDLMVPKKDMVFVKDTEKIVKDILKGVKVLRFTRYQLGEGIEKKETDFAAEVAAQIK